MPEHQLNTTEEAVVNVPTEGDNVEIELKEDLVKPDTTNV